MVDKFFIFCYPRSMSAWLSVYLTAASSRLVTHEIFGRTPSLVIKDTFFGNVGSDNLFYYKYILETFPNAKFIIVERDFKDVHTSLVKFGYDLDERQLSFIEERMLAVKAELPSYMHISYDQEKLALCQELCEALDIEFVLELAENLLRFNVQLEKVLI